MRALYAAAAAVLLTAPGAVVAQSPAVAQQEKKICKTERVTGSLTRRTRICLTESEWARMAEGTRRNVDTLQRDGDEATLAGRLLRDKPPEFTSPSF